MKLHYYIIDEAVSTPSDRKLHEVSYRMWNESIYFQIKSLEEIGMDEEARNAKNIRKALLQDRETFQTINGFTYVKTEDEKEEAEAWLL